jgi:thioesterase domain-containing protein
LEFTSTEAQLTALLPLTEGATVNLGHQPGNGLKRKFYAHQQNHPVPVPPLQLWRKWADDVAEVTFNCGHFIAEEVPEACADALGCFFGG